MACSQRQGRKTRLAHDFALLVLLRKILRDSWRMLGNTVGRIPYKGVQSFDLLGTSAVITFLVFFFFISLIV